jgi:peptidyl-prolyl cis-trans isomerase A (cyclophilin A)
MKYVVALFTVFLLSDIVNVHAADTFKLKFNLANLDGKKGEKGSFIMEIHPDWAPLGAERVKEMVADNFFKGIRFFRVINGFMAQFGIHGNPKKAAVWREKRMTDDPVKESNTRGMVSFATSGPNSRTTQMFINFGNNANLDGMGFAPFGKVIDGMDIVDRIFMIGEKPQQGRIQSEGNRYLKTQFPQLTYIESFEEMNNVEADL